MFLLAALAFGTVSISEGVKVSRQQQQLGRIAVTRDGSASLLLELLQGLQQETQAGLKLAGSSAKWCRVAIVHRRSMSEAVRRQLNEAKAAKQQLTADEARLGGEKGLVNSTVQEQERRLQEAQSLVEFATKEFSAERSHLSETLDASATAIRLLRQQSQDPSAAAGGGSLEESLLQLSPDHMNDAESSGVSSYLEDKTGDDKSQELLDLLVKLHSRLEEDEKAADQEHEGMTTKLKAFTERLNSSIMEARTQAATIRTEAAQRKREHARLERKAWDLSALAGAVEESGQAIKAACVEQKRQREDEAQQLAGESGAVKSMLKQLPRGSWLVDGSAPLAAAPSFLQVEAPSSAWARNTIDRALDELASLAQKFPDEASWYSKTSNELSSTNFAADVASDKAEEATVVDATTNATADSSGSALQNIESFVNSDGSDVLSTAPALTEGQRHELRTITDAYGGLLKHVRSEEKSAEDKRSWCKVILNSANADRSALKRSLNQVNAKIHIMDGAITDCEQSSKYNLEQKGIIAQQLTQLETNLAEADRQRERFLQVLGQRSKQLISAVTGLDEATAKQARELLRFMSSHQATLQRQHTHTPKLQGLVDAADKNVMRLLADDVRSDGLRLLRLRAEAKLLTSLGRARQRALAGFVGTDSSADMDPATAAAAAFCTQEGLPKQQQVQTLKQEEKSIEAAISSAGGADSDPGPSMLKEQERELNGMLVQTDATSA
jgi:hypothetical protein